MLMSSQKMRLLHHTRYWLNSLVPIYPFLLKQIFTLVNLKVQDLNLNPVLSFQDKSFDVVLLQLSVDYLKKPLELFKEVSRVLDTGGELIVR